MFRISYDFGNPRFRISIVLETWLINKHCDIPSLTYLPGLSVNTFCSGKAETLVKMSQKCWNLNFSLPLTTLHTGVLLHENGNSVSSGCGFKCALFSELGIKWNSVLIRAQEQVLQGRGESTLL